MGADISPRVEGVDGGRSMSWMFMAMMTLCGNAKGVDGGRIM
jgi:hypothetical protein